MTEKIGYNHGMNVSVQGLGALYTLLLLLLCVILIHGYKLAKIGYRTMRKKLPPEPPPKEQPEKEHAEPIYYIVERKKKKRAKTEYEPPKEIRFR